MTASFTILTVCTGNICRSPAAERLLGAALWPDVRVVSAGTGALENHPVEPAMAALMLNDGISPAGFAARQVTRDAVANADLILALTRDHRSRLVRLAPAALRRGFTLLEFARIVAAPEFPTLEGSVEERLREAVSQAGRRRSTGTVIHDDDVPDPYRRGQEAFDEAYGLISTAVKQIATAVGR